MNNNVENPGRKLNRYNTRRSSIGDSHKPYEHMLLKELPGNFYVCTRAQMAFSLAVGIRGM